MRAVCVALVALATLAMATIIVDDGLRLTRSRNIVVTDKGSAHSPPNGF